VLVLDLTGVVDLTSSRALVAILDSPKTGR